MEKFYFGYIYYRLQKFYKRWDGENGITAIIGVSMIQTLIVVDIFLIIIKFVYSTNEISNFSKLLGYSSVALLLGLMVYNYYKYKGKYFNFEKKWGSEPTSVQLFKSAGVIFSLIFPWVLLFAISKY